MYVPLPFLVIVRMCVHARSVHSFIPMYVERGRCARTLTEMYKSAVSFDARNTQRQRPHRAHTISPRHIITLFCFVFTGGGHSTVDSNALNKHNFSDLNVSQLIMMLLYKVSSVEECIISSSNGCRSLVLVDESDGPFEEACQQQDKHLDSWLPSAYNDGH